ncbi:MAG: hypothetical protein KDB27_33705, partial [Planctomycetales bacterium]|nr:hypothetical protein [Planctomycetales bacterium]
MRKNQFSKNRRSIRKTNASLRFEDLENRQMMAADVSYDAATHSINIIGTPEDDYVKVSLAAPDNNAGQTPTQLTIDVEHGRETVTYEFDLERLPGTRSFDSESLHILFDGRAGDDVFLNQTYIVSKAYGGAGNDKLTGGSGDDYLVGNAGSDELNGDYSLIVGGDDVLLGFNEDGHGNGGLLGSNDSGRPIAWFLGKGKEVKEVTEDDDILNGGLGDDELYGGPGVDSMHGGL